MSAPIQRPASNSTARKAAAERAAAEIGDRLRASAVAAAERAFLGCPAGTPTSERVAAAVDAALAVAAVEGVSSADRADRLATAPDTAAPEEAEWDGSCRTCAFAHPASGCADVECWHNCQAEIDQRHARIPAAPAAGEGVETVEYVVGFALDTRGRVALIRKNRPEWQAGRLNGIGGHVEPGEQPDAAMVREFHEETGTRLDGWQRFATMDFPGARIHFYRLRDLHPIRLDGLRTTTDEPVCVIDHRSIGQAAIIPNLSWLVPLAAYTADEYEPIHVTAATAEALTEACAPTGCSCSCHRPGGLTVRHMAPCCTPAAPAAGEGVETVEWGVRYGDGGRDTFPDESALQEYIKNVRKLIADPAQPHDAEDYEPMTVVTRTRVSYPDRVSEWTPVEPETSEPEGGGSHG